MSAVCSVQTRVLPDVRSSVVVFVACSLVCLGVLLARRVLLGGELGGAAGPRYATAALFVALWAVYLVISSLTEMGQMTAI